MDQLPARFVLASTSEVYGDPQERLQRETYWRHVNPIGPRSVYDEAKRYAEALTTAYRGTGRVDTAIARIFNTYGPRMRAGDGRAIPVFVDQALTGEPLTVTGDGKQTRSLCYVDDRVRRLLALAEAAGSGTVNLENPAELTMLNLAREIIELTGASSEIEYLPAMEDDRNDDARISRWHSPCSAGNRESRCAKALGTRSPGSRTRFAMYRTKPVIVVAQPGVDAAIAGCPGAWAIATAVLHLPQAGHQAGADNLDAWPHLVHLASTGGQPLSALAAPPTHRTGFRPVPVSAVSRSLSLPAPRCSTRGILDNASSAAAMPLGTGSQPRCAH
jgi:hypothetical protein